MCKAPSLILPDPSKPFQHTSDYAIGVVLYQDGKPITFEGKKLDLPFKKRVYLQLSM